MAIVCAFSFVVKRVPVATRTEICLTKPYRIMEDSNNTFSPTENSNNQKVTLNFSKILRVVVYIIGIISIIVSFCLYILDLPTYGSPFEFKEESYVGGDAYNYIISAARSSAVMVKSLIWMVFGCTMLIIGRLSAIKSKICK